MWKGSVEYYLKRLAYEIEKKFGFAAWNLRRNRYWTGNRNTRVNLVVILTIIVLLGLLTVFASEMLRLYQTSLYWQSWAFKIKMGFAVLLLGLFIVLALFIRFTDHK